MKNFVIYYKDWDSYNCDSEEEALKLFKRDHPEATIVTIHR